MVTKEQWAKVAEALSHPFGGGADFQIDGHSVKLRVVKKGKGLTYGIAAYIDGFVKGEYFSAESAIGAKFYRSHTICVYTPKERARWVKDWGKREAAKIIRKGTILRHNCFFPSAESARKTWAKTCTSIELVRVGFDPEPSIEGSE